MTPQIPAPVSRLAGAVVRRIPEPVLHRVAPSLLPFSPQDVPPTPPVPATPVRLYLGPANYAGQGYAWARAAERLPGVGAISMAAERPGGFGFTSDYPVPIAVYGSSRRWQRRQKAYVERFTHVVVEAQRALFGTLMATPSQRNGAHAEARALAAHGARVAMLCHGSDIRVPSRHLAGATPWSPFGDPEWELVGHLERQTRAAEAALVELRAAGIQTFVSTPDLLLDQPEATWLPVVVDPEVWRTQAPPLEREVPFVVHAPSASRLKGTELVEPVLTELDRRGWITYRRVEGVTSAQMPALYRDADVVLDQFALGSYGVAACEAMAAGRVVVSHVTQQSRDVVQAACGLDLPILEGTPDTLEDVFTTLLDDRAGAGERAARQGPELVRVLHDGAESARVLAPFLGVGAAEPDAGER